MNDTHSVGKNVNMDKFNSNTHTQRLIPKHNRQKTHMSNLFSSA